MQQIFEMQHTLNMTVLTKLGIDFALILSAPDRHGHWIENYRKALSAEYAELLRDLLAIPDGGEPGYNAKVEIVDILHFLVSLSQIVGIGADEAYSIEDLDPDCNGEPCNISEELFLALDDLQNSVKWKWWAQGGGYKPDKARSAVLQLWRCWWSLALELAEMDFDEVKALYIKKNEVNFKRQETGYNEDTKTEADNLSLHSE